MKKSVSYFLCSLIALASLGQSKKILGACTIDALKQEPFASWYTSGVTEYKPNPEILSQLKAANANKFTFKVFFGSWCGDSRRELPRMSKILNEISIPEKNI